jgi:hypothetical protein
MPCERYLIRLVQHASRQALPGSRLWTAAQLTGQAVVRFLRARNRDGYDIYFRPFVPDRNAGYILVDLDRCKPTVVDRMIANGHEPCAVTETSPGRLQAWVRISIEPVPLTIATAVARQLAQLYQADRASADGLHLGRLAGFTNQKPQRRLQSGWAPWVKIRYAKPVLASAPPRHEQSALLATERTPVIRRTSKQASCPTPADLRSALPTEALGRNDAVAIYNVWLRRLRIFQRFSAPDWSVVDLWIAKELLRSNLPPRLIKNVLQLASPHFPRSHSDPEDYLSRTLQRALQDLRESPFPARE